MMKRDSIRDILVNGGSVEVGRVTICDINDYYRYGHFGKKRWQVDSDDYRMKHSELYENIGEAVGRFLKIVKVTKG